MTVKLLGGQDVPAEALTAESLAVALEHVVCASVIVCGPRAAFVARRLVAEGKFVLKVHEHAERDPDGWELF